MDVKLELQKIYNNRLLNSEREIKEFEEAVANLISLEDTSIISDLCFGLDDDTEQFEVMFGLVHGIEYLYKENREEGLYLIAKTIPKVMDRAKDWVEILHYRILNHEKVRSVYKKVLNNLDQEDKKVVVSILKNIKDEDLESFGDLIDEVLKVK